MNSEDLRSYEARIQALEAQCQTPEEREINALVIRMVRSVRSTLWLMNGAVKYFAGPVGVAYGVWTYGAGIVDWLASLIAGGHPK